MKEGWRLIFIFLLICIESCSSLDYTNICQHDFSQGCPAYKGYSWSCAKAFTNCSGDQFNRYHCVLNSTGQPFKVIHTCAPLSQCVKGTIPIYDERKKAISCKTCPEGYYQSLNRWSDETPVCLEKHTCEKEGNKIDCDMGTGLSNTQDVHCRCDARNSYILLNFENREKCVEWEDAKCYFHPCPNGQERLLNYSCAALCPQGQKRDDNDICIPISLVNQTTSSLNDSLIISGETTPKTTTVTITPTSTSVPTSIDSNIFATIIVIAAVTVVVLIALFILQLKCPDWRQYLYTRCLSVMNHVRNRRQTSKVYTRCLSVMNRRRNRRQTSKEEATELERMGINQGTDADVASGNNSSQGARTNEGKTIIRHQEIYYVNADVAQFGNKNKVNKYNYSAEHLETSDDSSSNVSRHSSDSNLADSPHLPNSSQGELPVNSNLSSQRNSSEDIELDTQPKQISNGRGSSERHASCDRHADNEQTYRKVAYM